MSIEQKRKDAEELGIEVKAQWNEAKLDKEIEAALNAQNSDAGDDDPTDNNNADPEQTDDQDATGGGGASGGDDSDGGDAELESLSVKNTAPNRFRGAGLNLPAGESVELEEHVLKNERAMKIIARQVEIGRMEWVS